MHTTPIRWRRPLATVNLILLAAIAAACGGGQSAPELTDPTEIVTAMLKTTEADTSTHVAVTLTGSADVSLLGGTGAPFDLTGATAALDLDLAKGAAHGTFSVPTFFDLGGELIAVDGKAYLKTTNTGPAYQVVDLGSTLGLDLTDGKGLIDDLGDFLLGKSVTLTKGADASCGSAKCYTVKTTLGPEQLSAMLGGSAAGLPAGLPIDLSGSTLDVTVLVGKDAPRHLGGLTISFTKAGGKPLTVDLAFSKWDDAVTVTAPPADQVKGG